MFYLIQRLLVKNTNFTTGNTERALKLMDEHNIFNNTELLRGLKITLVDSYKKK